MQETVADELETAYKGRIWAPELRHVKARKQGIKAARVEIQTFTGDAKVHPHCCLHSLPKHHLSYINFDLRISNLPSRISWPAIEALIWPW